MVGIKRGRGEYVGTDGRAVGDTVLWEPGVPRVAATARLRATQALLRLVVPRF